MTDANDKEPQFARVAALVSDARELVDAGAIGSAIDHYERAAALGPDTETSQTLYSELAACRCHLKLWEAGLRACLRALDGDWARDQRTLALLVLACLRCERGLDAIAAIEVYEAEFGEHPSGLSAAQLRAADEEARELESRARPV